MTEEEEVVEESSHNTQMELDVINRHRFAVFLWASSFVFGISSWIPFLPILVGIIFLGGVARILLVQWKVYHRQVNYERFNRFVQIVYESDNPIIKNAVEVNQFLP